MNKLFKINLHKGCRHYDSPCLLLIILSIFTILLNGCGNVDIQQIVDEDLSYTLNIDTPDAIDEFFGENEERVRIYYSDNNTVRVFASKGYIKDNKIDWPKLELQFNLGEPLGWKPLRKDLEGELRLYKSKMCMFNAAVINNKDYSLILIENAQSKESMKLEKIIKRSEFFDQK